MRAWEVGEEFGFENLRLVEREMPKPGPEDVVIRLTAVSLNYRDLLMVQGHYDPRQSLPLIPCSDGVGEVVAVGARVSRVSIGDRVSPIFSIGWIDGEPSRDRARNTLGGPLDGTLCEYMRVPAEGVVKVPEHLTDEEAAAIPCAALTAWSAMVTYGNLRAGERVLLQGTGGVSIFALQLAKAMGAEVLITSSSDEKLARARALGADHTINYRTHPEWFREVKRLTDQEHVDQVVEVGGALTLEQSIRSVKFGGYIALIGILSGGKNAVNLTRILMQNIRIQGILVGHRTAFEAMNRCIAHHQIRPVVDRVFEFEEAKEAMLYQKSGAHFGKVVIRVAGMQAKGQ